MWATCVPTECIQWSRSRFFIELRTYSRNSDVVLWAYYSKDEIAEKCAYILAKSYKKFNLRSCARHCTGKKYLEWDLSLSSFFKIPMRANGDQKEIYHICLVFSI